MKKNKKEEPLNYIIGFKNFLDCKIDLSLKPLIPRPETEYWTKKAIEEIKKGKRKLTCLDIFSGSGCVGIAVLKNVKNANLDFAEKNKRFLEQIKINLKLNKINSRRYRLMQSDVFQNIKKKYNYIFANPPYVAEKRIDKVQKSVLKFEPKSALFGGKEGLFYIKKFLEKARYYLKEDGNPSSSPAKAGHYGARIYMEFDSIQKKEIEKILEKFGYKNYKFFKDQFGRWRYLAAD